MLPMICGAWSQKRATADSRFPALLSWIVAGITAAHFNNNEAADALGISPAALSNMREFRDSGPGIMRFANMPPAFWVGFLKAAAKHFCYRLIDEPWVDKMVAFMSLLQVERIQYQEKHMVKMALPVAAEERKRA